MKYFFTILLIFTFLTNLSAQDIPLKREHRGIWVATVGNIDWPSNRNATPGEQIKELVQLFDKYKEAGLNAVFFHIRTECDALYNSPYEPWAYWLTGEQGKAPSPLYDPLEFAISEAHARGMELHAWFNPYRAMSDSGAYKRSKNHVTTTHPEWLLNFGRYVMLDPSNPQVKDYVVKIVADVINRYDIDGIHFDDYFYPYSPKITKEDSLSFVKYNNGYTNIDDWRRYSINDLMAKLYNVFLATKPHIKFGISPFGVVENKYTGTNAFNSYSEIYCDPLTWLRDKTVDYITPQIYWEVGHNRADYSKILPWWPTVLNGRHLYVGLYSGKFVNPGYQGNKSELYDQIKMNRNTKDCSGQVFFSGRSVSNNVGNLLDSLKEVYYKYPALPPTMPWKDSLSPNSPTNLKVTLDSTMFRISWDKPEVANDGDDAKYYVLYKFKEGDKINLEDPRFIFKIISADRTNYIERFGRGRGRDRGQEQEKMPSLTGEKYFYVVTALDKLYNESMPSNIAKSSK